ncbi:MAG: type II toxin-antitoxin system VapC family toxin [Armatimonadota bacterium]|nr:type II toxin-antitoxin system VapC family toxin [bacterium]MDW8321863.1 type II toxin-antitoxin system VapC family toxin [Armatimonadota bacterium]
MDVFIDSSVLVRLKDPDLVLRRLAEEAIERLDANGFRLLLSAQVLMEYWTVATRPPTARGGLGLTFEEATLDVQAYRNWFGMVQEDERLFSIWWRVVQDHRVLGRQVWDARIAAIMRLHGVLHLLTFNAQDFARFDFIRAWLPQEVDAMFRAEG